VYKLSINHLQTVVAIEENHGNMTQASRKLNLSQSALSHRLQEAETRLGIQLFHRRNKKLFLSKSGRLLYTSAKSILNQLHKTEFDIERMMGGLEHVIRFSTSSYDCYHWYPKVLKEFSIEHPGIDIEIVAEANQDPLYALRHGTIDLAITHLKSDPMHFSSVEIMDDEMVAIVPADHPLAKKQFLQHEDFEDQVFITNATRTMEGREYELFFKHGETLPKRILCAGHTDVVVNLVREKTGVSILTRWIMECYAPQRKVVQKRLGQKGIFIKWYAVTRKNTPPSEKVFLFLEKLKQLKPLKAINK